ncbi:ABC transporter permease [Brevibacillus composti]|uniref:ABC transporter permease n=1 Tax=Brevibacillus composti TaxID=2796470 RepID=A0A7T5ELJ8_9BACL|nr:ABC transporter permease [Brevibacillus composti]QQE74772.1 ABC transporter permease [Brevibacillus composti]QUO41857.1 ABC transporter permease [Brevibacillus composti]
MEAKKFSLFDIVYKYGTVAVIAIVILLFSLTNPYFFTYGNITDILRSISIVTFVAIGVTFSLIVGGFDLSVGSTVSLTTVVSASMMVWHEQGPAATLLIPIALAVVVGLLNALLVVKIRIPDLLATLAMLYIVNGVHMTYSKGYSIYANMPMQDGTTAPGKFQEWFLWLGQGEIFSVPVPVVLTFLLVAATHIYLTYTRQGRMLYMTGGNAEAARLSGIPVNRYRTWAYVLSALFAGLGGMLLAARIGTGQVSSGGSLLMDAVAAAFVGFSVFGVGKPNVLGTFVGAILIGVLLNGMTMLNLPYYAYDIVKGIVLALALAVTYYQLRRKRA